MVSTKFSSHDNFPNIDNFYIDLNCLIHDKFSNSNQVYNYENQIKELKEELKVLVKELKPSGLIFIAVDGVAPLAKLELQRKRRFSRVNKEDIINYTSKEGKSHLFSPNLITPGTGFMDRLGKDLVAFLMEMMNSTYKDRAIWIQPKVIYSGHEVPGEAEHKIIAYMRSFKASSNYDPNLVHCIYSNDADMIILGLVTHIPATIVVRKQQNWPNKRSLNALNLEMIFLNKLRTSWFNEFDRIEDENMIDDLILLIALVGNDFLPNLKEVSVNFGGLDQIFLAYYDYFKDGSPLPLIRDSLIQLPHLQGVLIKLKENSSPTHMSFREVGLINSIKSFLKNSASESMGIRHELNASQFGLICEYVDYYGLRIIPSIQHESLPKNSFIGMNFDRAQCRAKIIKPDNFNFNSNPPLDPSNPLKYFQLISQNGSAIHNSQSLDTEQSRAESYVHMLQWVMSYYYYSVPSWQELYPYSHSPIPISELLKIDSFDPHFSSDLPLTRYQQLLVIMPPTDSYMLPLPFKYLMTDPKSPLAKYFSFNNLIPIDFKLFMNCYENCYKQLDKEEKQMDLWGQSLIFKFKNNLFSPHPYILP